MHPNPNQLKRALRANPDVWTIMVAHHLTQTKQRALSHLHQYFSTSFKSSQRAQVQNRVFAKVEIFSWSKWQYIQHKFCGQIVATKIREYFKKKFFTSWAQRAKKIKENFGEFCEFPCQNGKSMLLSKYKFCASLAWLGDTAKAHHLLQILRLLSYNLGLKKCKFLS